MNELEAEKSFGLSPMPSSIWASESHGPPLEQGSIFTWAHFNLNFHKCLTMARLSPKTYMPIDRYIIF